MKRRIFLFSLPILLLAWFFVFGATARAAEIVMGLSPIKPPQAAKKAAARPQVMHI